MQNYISMLAILRLFVFREYFKVVSFESRRQDKNMFLNILYSLLLVGVILDFYYAKAKTLNALTAQLGRIRRILCQAWLLASLKCIVKYFFAFIWTVALRKLNFIISLQKHPLKNMLD